MFKHEWGFEPYLTFVDNHDKRVLLAKFRIGICPLRVETGRYENNGDHKGIQPHERVCLVCNSVTEIEDEFHFLLKCEKHHELRNKMFASIRNTACNINVNNSDEDELFRQVMDCKNEDVINNVATYIWDSFCVREKILLNRT